MREEDIEATMASVIERGGRTKSLHGADGKKIDYHRGNATCFSALDEDEQRLRLARSVVRDQIALTRPRNTSPAFKGEWRLIDGGPDQLHPAWHHPRAAATLQAELRNHGFSVSQRNGSGDEARIFFARELN